VRALYAVFKRLKGDALAIGFCGGLLILNPESVERKKRKKAIGFYEKGEPKRGGGVSSRDQKLLN